MTDKILDTAPAPAVHHWDWLNEVSQLAGKFNMRAYRNSKTDQKITLVEATKRITSALRSKLLVVELVTIGGEKVNCYEMSEDAKVYWQNGREQNLSPKEIADGWDAMQSMFDDQKPTDA